jgi:peroxiredoxin
MAPGFLSLLLTTLAFAAPAPAAATPASLVSPTQLQSRDLLTEAPRIVDLAQPSRATVLVFVSAKCPCSRSHEAALQAYAREFAPQGVAFVAVHANGDESEPLAREHFRAAALPFPVLSDPEQKLADRYGALKTPHVFVLSPSGEVLYQGGVDDSKDAARAHRHFLKDALDAVVAGKRPERREARSLGCVIKRKGT